MTARQLRISHALWTRRENYRRRKLARVRRENHADHKLTPREVAQIHKWEDLLAEAQRMTKRRRRQIANLAPLRERAYKVAAGLVGIMESGGNNAGPMVSKIIHANGGVGPEPWCGDFCAYCYRLAGSRSVTRAWASVRLLGAVAGVTRTASPRRGDLVRFSFDHVGMFVKDNGDGSIETIEGNTGASGAVSDSSTGGDGVYRKRRSKGLVSDYLRVGR
jgi:hypothetical protein